MTKREKASDFLSQVIMFNGVYSSRLYELFQLPAKMETAYDFAYLCT